jgi:hypothetical protein
VDKDDKVVSIAKTPISKDENDEKESEDILAEPIQETLI